MAKYATDEERKLARKAQAKAWRERNTEKVREISRRSYNKHRDKIFLRTKLWREKNPNYFYQYYEKHRDRLLARAKARYHSKKLQAARLTNDSD